MPIRVVTAPTVLPVSLATALRHIRAFQDDADLVALYLQAAVEAVEDYTGRCLITRTLCLDMDSWPNYRSFWPTFRSYVPTEIHPLWKNDNLRAIELRRTPLVAITSLKYYAPGDTALTTWDIANYQADTASTPGRIVFVENGVSLPDVDKRRDAVQITFTAGYGTKAKNVPAMLKLAVLQLARHWYDNKSAVADAKIQELPMATRHLLRAMRVDALTPVK